jgi:hypothetical protein
MVFQKLIVAYRPTKMEFSFAKPGHGLRKTASSRANRLSRFLRAEPLADGCDTFSSLCRLAESDPVPIEILDDEFANSVRRVTRLLQYLRAASLQVGIECF